MKDLVVSFHLVCRWPSNSISSPRTVHEREANRVKWLTAPFDQHPIDGLNLHRSSPPPTPKHTKSLFTLCSSVPYLLSGGRWWRAKFKPSRLHPSVSTFCRGRRRLDISRQWRQYPASTLRPNSRRYSTWYKEMATTSRGASDRGLYLCHPSITA